VQVEVQDVVVAVAVVVFRFFEMLQQRLERAGADDVDGGAELAGFERFDERARNGAVAHVAAARWPGGEQQHAQLRRFGDPRRIDHSPAILAHHRLIDRQRMGPVRILQRLPVQRVKLRRADNLQQHAAALHRTLVLRIQIGIAPEHLRKERLAILPDDGRGPLRPHLVGKRKVQPPLEVPLKLIFLFGACGIGDGQRRIWRSIFAEPYGCRNVLALAGLFLDENRKCHGVNWFKGCRARQFCG